MSPRLVVSATAAHGGDLKDLLVPPERAAGLLAEAAQCASWELTPRQLCDLELLVNGGFSPLEGFMARAEYEAASSTMSLADGTLWPIPIVLDVTEQFAKSLRQGQVVALRDARGVALALLHAAEIWQPNRLWESGAVYGTTSIEHPGVKHLLEKTNPWYVGGRVEALRQPQHFDFAGYRPTPQQLRREFSRRGWERVIAFQTCHPMHRRHFELTMRAAREYRAGLLIHPVAGITRPGDVDHFTRVRCYQAVLEHCPPNTAMLALLPLATRRAGPREALLQAIVCRNYGCTHLIFGGDDAGPGRDGAEGSLGGPDDAQKLVQDFQERLGVSVVPPQRLVYWQERNRYFPEDEVPPEARSSDLSAAELRRRLAVGEEIPEWFTFPGVAAELRRRYPPRSRQGFTVFFTGLSAAGKSTLASALWARLLETDDRPVTLLDGDAARKNLSAELGFSKEHRDTNIRRIGLVASLITKSGGIALCAPIAPYDAVRKEVRKLIQQSGGFLLVHVSTPLEVCEKRDRKGLYAKARAGLIPAFTGISDPYEPPEDAEVTIDTSKLTPEQCATAIVLHLQQQGYLGTGA